MFFERCALQQFKFVVHSDTAQEIFNFEHTPRNIGAATQSTSVFEEQDTKGNFAKTASVLKLHTKKALRTYSMVSHQNTLRSKSLDKARTGLEFVVADCVCVSAHLPVALPMRSDIAGEMRLMPWRRGPMRPWFPREGLVPLLRFPPILVGKLTQRALRSPPALDV